MNLKGKEETQIFLEGTQHVQGILQHVRLKDTVGLRSGKGPVQKSWFDISVLGAQEYRRPC